MFLCEANAVWAVSMWTEFILEKLVSHAEKLFSEAQHYHENQNILQVSEVKVVITEWSLSEY